METASLCVRFSPLLNKALKNGSKCFLEIVPEVACVENFDKISWKKENDFIEYTIPMTYKVIFKKRKTVKKTYNDLVVDMVELEKTDNDLFVDMVELEKTYHSCVDLLSASMSAFDFASGGLNSILSDTFILGNISSNIYDDKHLINDNPVNGMESNFTEIQLTDCSKELLVLKHSHHPSVFLDKKDMINDDKVNKLNNDILLINDSSANDIKSNFTEIQLTDCPKQLSLLKQSLDRSVFLESYKKHMRYDGKAKVYDNKHVINDNFAKVIESSFTEIQRTDCHREHLKQSHDRSVFVDEKDIIKHNAIPRSLTLSESFGVDKITNTEIALTLCNVTETQSVKRITEISTPGIDDLKRKLSLSPICSIDTNDNPFHKIGKDKPINLVVEYETTDFIENVAPNLLTRNEKYVKIQHILDDGRSVYKLNKTQKRELPEVRVAKFIKKMETEIMPLKIMLNDIILKCSKLGLSNYKYIGRNLVLYKTVPSCKKPVEKHSKTERQTRPNRVVYSIVFDG